MPEEHVAALVLGLVAAGLGLLVHRLTLAAAHGRLRRNYYVGLRIGRTLADDASWRAGHRAALTWTRRTAIGAGALGLLAAALSFLLPGASAPLVGLVPILVVLVGAILAARAAHRALG